jgi:dephospho-CoA kinase
MISVGLTGNFGMGKTTILKLFGKLGALTFNIDDFVHEILEMPETVAMIVEVLGEEVLKGPKKNSLDKKRVAEIVFSRPEKRKAVESIIHPVVFRKIETAESKILRENPSAIVVFEVPLLFESNVENNFDKIIVVYCDRSSTAGRLMEKGFSKDEIAKRTRAQMPITRKKKMADFVINNSESLRETNVQAKRIFAELLRASRA